MYSTRLNQIGGAAWHLQGVTGQPRHPKGHRKIQLTSRDSCFFGGRFGSKIASIAYVRPSVRPSARPSVKIPIVIGVFWGIQNSVLILFARSPPKMHGQVRWSKFWSRDLTAKNTIVQSVGQKFRPRDLTAKKYHRASVRPGGRPSRYKS